MHEQVFKNVWFLPEENKWSDLNIMAFRDTGTLIVREDSLEFQGGKERVVMNYIQQVSFGKQGRDFINNWVKVEYGSSSVPLTAFFADGSSLGWGGIFGGTERILNAIKQVKTTSYEEAEKVRLQSAIEAGLICPTCHREIPPGTKYCPNDGTPIGKICQSCEAVNLPLSKFCINCGKAL